VEFKLRIELGNDAMRTRGDVARALAAVAERFEDRDDEFTDESLGLTFVIRDENGNTVGRWEVTE
jgi:hypothetical protein